MNHYNLWECLPANDKANYIQFLQVFGALSGLFKDIEIGGSANKPYLYYRNHEQLFAKVFAVEDLTRSDSAFDAIATLVDGRVGIGLKTWIHLRDITFQKVAEFNKLALTVIRPLIDDASPDEVIRQIAHLRNERIALDQRTYKTTHMIYHNVTRSDNQMNIVECRYDLIDLESLKFLGTNKDKSVFDFEDHRQQYKFYVSKSVLLQAFDASSHFIQAQIPITLFKDPFDLLAHIQLTLGEMPAKAYEDSIYLPIYADRGYQVEEKSGFNAWNAAPKSKGSTRPRPDFEAYIPMPIWIHHLFPNFFGFDALNDEARKGNNGFRLHLPSGEIIDAIITQQQGKSLQSNPQSILGQWILQDVLGLEARQLLTIDRLNLLGVDSLKITQMDNHNFKIDLADSYAFEKWKLSLQAEIENCVEIKQKPVFRPYLLAE